MLAAKRDGVFVSDPQAWPGQPDPLSIHGKQGFFDALVRLREGAHLSVREIASQVPMPAGGEQPHSTLGEWFAGRSLPGRGSEQIFTHVLRICGVTDEVVIGEWLQALRRARRRRRANELEPYRGLRSYRPEDADWYFGRTELAVELVDRLAKLYASGGGIQVVVGASGSGKTSLLQAGLIPAIRDGKLAGLSTWRIVLFTPGAEPVAELTAKLAEEEGASPDQRASAACDSSLTVLVVDQLEQLFTACRDAEEQRVFTARLCEMAADGALVVLGVRADFYAQVLRYPSLLDAVRDGQLTVGPMTEHELRQAIVEPAAKANAELEPGLVELLVREVSPRDVSRTQDAHDAGALPLLFHALYAMWKHTQGRRMTGDSYREVGGIDGAVAATADRVYWDLSEPQRELARRLFLDLVHVSVDGRDTRRRVELDVLIGDDGHAQQLRQVLDRFVAQRLITVDADTVEISHEAVLTAWPQLQRWLGSDRAGLVIGQQLTSVALAWRADGDDKGALYQGARLAAAQEWVADRRRYVPPVTAAFVEASARYARQRTRRLYQTITALVVLLTLAVCATIVALNQRGSAISSRHAANRERDEAQSRAIALRALQLHDKDPSLARQLALVAYQVAPTIEARSALIDASAIRPAIRLHGENELGIMYSAAFHPSGRVLAAGTETGVRLWDVTDLGAPVPLGQLSTGQDAKVYSVAFSPDGQILAVASADATVRMWNTTNPKTPTVIDHSLTGLGGKVYSLAFSPDGHLLAAASADGTVHLWALTGAGQPARAGKPLPVPGGPAKSVAFRSDSRTLAVGSADGSIGLWDLTHPERPDPREKLTGPTKEIGQVAFSPDGRMLAAGSADFNAYLWNVTDPATPTPLGPAFTGATSWINTVSFSPDSTFLAVGSSDSERGVRIFDVTSRHVIAIMPHPVPVTAVKFSPDGSTVVTAANDGKARLWPLAAPTLTLPGLVSATRFSPDGRTLAVGSDDTRLFDVTDPRRPRQLGPGLPNPDDFNSALAFTADGRTLAAAHGRSGTVALWNVADPSEPARLGPLLIGHTHQVETVAFSPNARILATGSRDDTVRLWDTTSPATTTPLVTLEGFKGSVFWVTFSPDGRFLAASSSDKTIRIWDVNNPASPTPIGEPIAAANHYLYTIAFTPDGRTLAAGGADRTVRLWDVANPAEPKPIGDPLRGPTNYIYAIAFTDDGRTLAATSTDGAVWLWNVSDRQHPVPVAALTLSNDAVFPVDFHPDQRTLVAGGAEKAVWIWLTDPDLAARHVCATTGDPITRSEWATYVPDRPYQSPCRQ